jgi:hypothetical protein
VAIALSVGVLDSIVVIHGVYYGGRDYEQLLRDAPDDD